MGDEQVSRKRRKLRAGATSIALDLHSGRVGRPDSVVDAGVVVVALGTLLSCAASIRKREGVGKNRFEQVGEKHSHSKINTSAARSHFPSFRGKLCKIVLICSIFGSVLSGLDPLPSDNSTVPFPFKVVRCHQD